MQDTAGDTSNTRHNLRDWLAVHGLSAETCRDILADVARTADDRVDVDKSDAAYSSPGPEALWAEAVAALHDFLPAQRRTIDDTFANTARMMVERGKRSRNAFTLDNGVEAYPTIVFSYLGEPSDALIMAHEFGHAVQIRASRGRFVTPVMREVCAFLAEGALIAHALRGHPERHATLIQIWRKDNGRYFGAQANALQAALADPSTAYRYSWNYPIARYLAIQAHRLGLPDWIWSIFEGSVSVRDALPELTA